MRVATKMPRSPGLHLPLRFTTPPAFTAILLSYFRRHAKAMPPCDAALFAFYMLPEMASSPPSKIFFSFGFRLTFSFDIALIAFRRAPYRYSATSRRLKIITSGADFAMPSAPVTTIDTIFDYNITMMRRW